MSRNGNKWSGGITHRDVAALVEEIGAEHGLLCNFRVQYTPSVVVVTGTAEKPIDVAERETIFVAKHTCSVQHAKELTNMVYRVAWDLWTQADTGVRGSRDGDRLW